MTLRSFFLSIFCPLGMYAAAQPVASFTTSRTKVCSGSKVYLSNTSTGATDYQWLVEDTVYSSNMNDSIVMVEGCWELQSIKLIAYNALSWQSDTIQKLVEVFDSCSMHMHGDFGNCIGDTIRRQSHPEAVSQTWLIDPPHNLLTGCDTCDSISFVLATLGTTVQLKCTYEGGCSQRTSYHYAVCNPLIGTGIEETVKADIGIYPNPAREIVHIELNSDDAIRSVTLYSQTGTVIARCLGQDVSLVDVSQLAAGMYYLKIETGKHIFREKLVKE